MPTYNYICNLCNHTYSETRQVSESQFYVKCNGCNDGDYQEVSS